MAALGDVDGSEQWSGLRAHRLVFKQFVVYLVSNFPRQMREPVTKLLVMQGLWGFAFCLAFIELLVDRVVCGVEQHPGSIFGIVVNSLPYTSSELYHPPLTLVLIVCCCEYHDAWLHHKVSRDVLLGSIERQRSVFMGY